MARTLLRAGALPKPPAVRETRRAGRRARSGPPRGAAAGGARDMSRILTRFPQGFLWGAATSAHQVEGGNRWNDWWRFEQQPGAIRGGDASGDACRHWERFDAGLRAARAADGHNAAPALARVEPHRARARAASTRRRSRTTTRCFASLRRHGLTPLVTLHHFTNPLWIADAGGWESRATHRPLRRVRALLRARVRRRGGLVVHGERARGRTRSAPTREGVWPPGSRDDGRGARA